VLGETREEHIPPLAADGSGISARCWKVAGDGGQCARRDLDHLWCQQDRERGYLVELHGLPVGRDFDICRHQAGRLQLSQVHLEQGAADAEFARFDAAIGAVANWSRPLFEAAERFAGDRGVDGVEAGEQGGLVALAGQDTAEDSGKGRPVWLLGLLG
jgi:hypothetical protein